MHFACWTTKATDTHSEYVIPIAFHSNIGYMNTPQMLCYTSLPVLSFFLMHISSLKKGIFILFEFHVDVCK